MKRYHYVRTELFWTLILGFFVVTSPSPVGAQEVAVPASMSQPQAVAVPGSIQGMWVWREDWVNTDRAQDEMLDFCQRFGFNLLLVQIHNDRSAGEYKIKYPAELTRLVAEAGKRGIVVEALDGANDMAFAENHAQTLAMLDALIDLNQSMPEGRRFAGVHYDIEPYTSDRWKAGQDNRNAVMAELLDFYAKARQKLDDRGSAMTLSCDIPMWYDAKTAADDHCIVTYNGQRKNLHEHIQDLCDYVGIMSYRQKALGPNSASEQIANELAYAEKIGKFVCGGLETIRLDDTPQITFYGKAPAEFWEQVKLLNGHYAGRPGYGGVLLHCYRGLRDLLLEE